MTRCEQLAEEILSLPVEDRAYVRDLLDQSLASEGDDVGLSPEWIAEIQRRVDEIERGEARTVPWEVVKARLERTILEVRQGRRRDN